MKFCFPPSIRLGLGQYLRKNVNNIVSIKVFPLFIKRKQKWKFLSICASLLVSSLLASGDAGSGSNMSLIVGSLTLRDGHSKWQRDNQQNLFDYIYLFDYYLFDFYLFDYFYLCVDLTFALRGKVQWEADTRACGLCKSFFGRIQRGNNWIIVIFVFFLQIA